MYQKETEVRRIDKANKDENVKKFDANKNKCYYCLKSTVTLFDLLHLYSNIPYYSTFFMEIICSYLLHNKICYNLKLPLYKLHETYHEAPSMKKTTLNLSWSTLYNKLNETYHVEPSIKKLNETYHLAPSIANAMILIVQYFMRLCKIKHNCYFVWEK